MEKDFEIELVSLDCKIALAKAEMAIEEAKLTLIQIEVLLVDIESENTNN